MLHVLFTKNARNTLKVSYLQLVTAEPLFIAKTIDWVHQTGPRKHSILLSVTHTLYINQSVMVLLAVQKRWELFFVKPGVKVNVHY